MIFSFFTRTVSTSSFASPLVIHPLRDLSVIRCVTIVSSDNRKLTISPVSTSACNVSTMMMLPTGSSGAMEALMIKKIRKRQRPYAVRISIPVKIHTFLAFTFFSLQRSLPGCCRMHPFLNHDTLCCFCLAATSPHSRVSPDAVLSLRCHIDIRVLTLHV